jgi:hypothetical protein
MSEKTHVVTKEGELKLDHVDDTLNRMNPGHKDEILQSFDTFKAYLKKRIKLGQSIGLNEEQMALVAQHVADYLAATEEPRNREEKLLQELWKVGNEEQRHKLAHLLVKLAQTAG